MFLCAILSICPPWVHLQVLGILFPSYLSNLLFIYIHSVPIFYTKSILQPLNPVFGFSSRIFHQLVGIIFSLLWNMLFYLYCLTLSRYLLSLSSFANIFWFIFSSSSLRLICCFVLFLLSQHILECFSFLSIFANCHSFFIRPFSQISHLCFVFLFGFLRGTPILSLTRFAPA